MPVTVTRTVHHSSVAMHTISFRGLAGAILVVLACSSILYVIGFSTIAWRVNGGRHDGLWESCDCSKHGNSLSASHHATQAMITIGLIGLVIAMILIILYMCASVSKNATIMALVIVCFLSVIFMLIGFLVFGVEAGNRVHWSFGITVVAAILCLVAGILALVQMRESGVHFS